VISDVLRGLPAIYALYAGYDDVCHFAGKETPEAAALNAGCANWQVGNNLSIIV
jgi:hypothetical protein